MPSAHSLTDHDEIRRWAEARDARPTCVKGTGRKGDTGMIRLDFPGFSGGESLQPISWDRWFKSFDDNNLALLVQDKTARGGRSNFNKLVTRASRTRRGSSSGSRRRGSVKRTSSASQRHTAAERTTGRKRTSAKRPSTRARTSRRQSRRSRGR